MMSEAIAVTDPALDAMPETYLERKARAWEQVVLAYSDYYVTVSPQPINLPSARFIFWEALDAVESACDLGSGFSSALLRFYAERVRPIDVFSVDDKPEWLERTRQFLLKVGLRDERLLLLDEVVADRALGVDLVIHDMGSNLFQRIRTFPLAQRLAWKAIFVDDTNYFFYRWPLNTLFRSNQPQSVGKHPAFRKFGMHISVDGHRLSQPYSGGGLRRQAEGA